MPYRRHIITAMLLLITFGACAQQGGMDILDHLLIKVATSYRDGVSRERYEGSPFLSDTFSLGYVYSGKEKFNAVSMRYNIFNDVIEFQYKGQTYLLSPEPRIGRIELGKEVLVVRNVGAAKKESGYFELVEDGKLKLLAKKVVNYRNAAPPQGIPAKYSRQPDIYYVQLDDRSLTKVNSVKGLISDLPDKQQEMLEFAKEERISARDRDDLAKLVRYYNSL